MPDHLPWVERILRDAADEGVFDELPGSGRPIDDLAEHYEPGWWAARWIERERTRERALELVAEVRRSLPRLLAGADDASARHVLEQINERIAELNDTLGVSDRVAPLDIEQILTRRSRG